MIEDFRWRGKLLVFTWHFKKEFEKLRKPLEFVLEILEKGEHILISKRQNKHTMYFILLEESIYACHM